MKKNKIFLLLTGLLLAACTPNTSSTLNSTDSTNHTTSSTETDVSSSNDSNSTNSDLPTTSEEGSGQGSENSDSSSQTPVTNITSLAEAKELAYALAPKVNNRMVATDTTINVVLTAELRTVHDFATTKSGYTTRYKALIANNEGYIFASLDLGHYNYVKDYRHAQNTYEFTGYIALYNGEPEIVLTAKPVLKNGVNLDVNLDHLHTKYQTISDLTTSLESRKMNVKGIGFDLIPVEIELLYLMKLENEVHLFTDGQQVIQVHGASNVGNNFSLNSVYHLTLLLGKHEFKVTSEYIESKSSTKLIEVSYQQDNKLSAADLYKYSYEDNDKNEDSPTYLTKNLEYGKMFNTIYYFEGYVNYFVKDGRANIIFEDTAKNFYPTYNNLGRDKALADNNNNSEKIDFGVPGYSPFIEQADLLSEEKELVSFYYIAYSYHTQKYWQVQAIEDTYLVNGSKQP